MKLDIGGGARHMVCANNPDKYNHREYTVVDRYMAEYEDGGERERYGRFERIDADMRSLPFDDESIDAIYSAHTLEHIPMRDVVPTLIEWHRVLKPGGELFIVVPSLEYCIRQWLDAAEEDRWGFKHDCIFAKHLYPGDSHLTGYTALRLCYYLREAGFQFGDEQVTESFGECHDQNEIRALVHK